MALNLSMPGQDELKPRITVFGVGGAGGNAVNNMIEKQLDGVDFVVANTDAQALSQSIAISRAAGGGVEHLAVDGIVSLSGIKPFGGAPGAFPGAAQAEQEQQDRCGGGETRESW